MKSRGSFIGTLEKFQGASPKSLGQVSRIVYVEELGSDEAGNLADMFSQNPFILGESWEDLEQIVQDPGVITFATVTSDEKLESISIASVNGHPPCRDLKVRSAFERGVCGLHPRSIKAKDGIIQVVYVTPSAQGQGIGGAHLLAQLHALKKHGCERAWALFNMTVGRAAKDGRSTFWDRQWWDVLHRFGFSERGPLGDSSGRFHAKCVELSK